MKKLSPAATEGQKVADWLLERTPRRLFAEYMLRPGSNATNHAVSEAEERAWYAAWHTAMGLITGATFSRIDSHHANALGSRKARD